VVKGIYVFGSHAFGTATAQSGTSCPPPPPPCMRGAPASWGRRAAEG
jgi:hypothetical protein